MADRDCRTHCNRPLALFGQGTALCGLVGSGYSEVVQDTLELGMSPDSPGEARHFVADHMRLWGHESLIHDAMLLTSEVVTNAVTHAVPPVELTVEHLQGGVVVLVADGAHGPAELQSSGGRGLRIVD